jgi:hypothetical protein
MSWKDIGEDFLETTGVLACSERTLVVQIDNFDKDIGIKNPQKPQSTNDTGLVGEE